MNLPDNSWVAISKHYFAKAVPRLAGIRQADQDQPGSDTMGPCESRNVFVAAGKVRTVPCQIPSGQFE
jgi:hypothetical protein